MEWNDTLKKEFRASNDEDLGEINDTANGHILVQMGAIIKKNFHFHIRITLLKKRIKSSFFFSVKKLTSKPIFRRYILLLP